jgi:hypothetical protein
VGLVTGTGRVAGRPRGALFVRLLLTREPVDGAVTEHIVDLVLAGIMAPERRP